MVSPGPSCVNAGSVVSSVGGEVIVDSSPGADVSSYSKCRVAAEPSSGLVRTVGKSTERKLSAGRADNKCSVVSPDQKTRSGGRRQGLLAPITSSLTGRGLGVGAPG